MAKNPTRKTVDEPSPDRSIDVPAPLPSSYEPSHVIQLLVEMQRELAVNATKLDRAIGDLSKLDDKLGDLRSSFTWIKGFAAAAVILVPICAGIVWWFVGDQIGQMRSQLLNQSRSAPPAVQSPIKPN